MGFDFSALECRQDWIDSYKKYGDPKPLADAVERGDSDVSSLIMRKFIADIIRGKEVLSSKKDPDNKLRNASIILQIYRFKGAGIAIKTSADSGTDNCCTMVGGQYGLSQETVYKNIWKERKKIEDELLLSSWEIDGAKISGRMIREYLNKKPESLNEINNTHRRIIKLPEKKHHNLWVKADKSLKKEKIKAEKNKFKKKVKEYAKGENIKLTDAQIIKFFAKLDALEFHHVNRIPLNLEVVNCIKYDETVT